MLIDGGCFELYPHGSIDLTQWALSFISAAVPPNAACFGMYNVGLLVGPDILFLLKVFAV